MPLDEAQTNRKKAEAEIEQLLVERFEYYRPDDTAKCLQYEASDIARDIVLRLHSLGLVSE